MVPSPFLTPCLYLMSAACHREATGGSFVRASKPIHLGESLIYAIADAYLEPFSSQERSKKMMFQTKTVEIDLVEAPPRQ